MSRIPNEGLKQGITSPGFKCLIGLNEQNPERGIETYRGLAILFGDASSE